VTTASNAAVTQHARTSTQQASLLSALWVFVTLNYLYCDIITVMDPEIFKDLATAHMGDLEVTQGFLLGAGILVEIPIAMTILSRVLHGGARRWTNVAAGVVMTIVQLASLLVGTPTPYYLFFSVIEIATTAGIAWYAWSRLSGSPEPDMARG
jgi:hypothetical protein